MRIRLPLSTPEWICGSISEHAIEKNHQQSVDESLCLCALSCTGSSPRVERVPRRPGREPDRVHHACYWRLDPALPRDHARRYAAAQAAAMARPDSVSANAGTVRILLRLSSFPDVRL